MLTFYKEGAWINRLSVWATIFTMLWHSLGMGIGAGGVEALFGKLYVHPFPVGDVPPHAHSLYLDVLAHFGFIGFFFLIILIVRLGLYFYRSLKNTQSDALRDLLWALCCGLIAVGMQLTITGLLHISELWVYLGMTTACARLATQGQSLEN
jgi:O-antigen ligase